MEGEQMTDGAGSDVSFSFDFDNAIVAHKVWLRHLEFFIEGLETDFVGLDSIDDYTRCSLGQWIGGPGQKYAGLACFSRLDTVHRQFHKVAAQVAGHIRDARLKEADALLRGPLSGLSAEIVQILEEMKQDFHTPRRPAA